MRKNENFEDQLDSSSKGRSHVQLNLKKIAGKISLEMGLLKYTFDNKTSVMNEWNAVQRGEFLSYSEFCCP